MYTFWEHSHTCWTHGINWSSHAVVPLSFSSGQGHTQDFWQDKQKIKSKKGEKETPAVFLRKILVRNESACGGPSLPAYGLGRILTLLTHVSIQRQYCPNSTCWQNDALAWFNNFRSNLGKTGNMSYAHTFCLLAAGILQSLAWERTYSKRSLHSLLKFSLVWVVHSLNITYPWLNTHLIQTPMVIALQSSINTHLD